MALVHRPEGTPAMELLVRESDTYCIADLLHGFVGRLHHSRGSEAYDLTDAVLVFCNEPFYRFIHIKSIIRTTRRGLRGVSARSAVSFSSFPPSLFVLLGIF